LTHAIYYGRVEVLQVLRQHLLQPDLKQQTETETERAMNETDLKIDETIAWFNLLSQSSISPISSIMAYNSQDKGREREKRESVIVHMLDIILSPLCPHHTEMCEIFLNTDENFDKMWSTAVIYRYGKVIEKLLKFGANPLLPVNEVSFYLCFCLAIFLLNPY
jgi:leucyl-tRNA synthetase